MPFHGNTRYNYSGFHNPIAFDKPYNTRQNVEKDEYEKHRLEYVGRGKAA